MSNVKLKKFLLRYYPPGIILQYERDGVMKQKPIDLLDLTPDVDVEVGRLEDEALDRGPPQQRAALCSPYLKQQHTSVTVGGSLVAGTLLPDHSAGASYQREQVSLGCMSRRSSASEFSM